MSSRLPSTVDYSLEEFSRHGDLTAPNRDGWGIVYYETSRGCPFRCSFCLSARDNLVRSFRITSYNVCYTKLLRVHLFGSFYLGQRAFKVMKSKGYGRIVNVSSTTALVGIPGLANYAAAKGGILGLTHAMAAEGAEYGIKVNALVPSAQGKMQAKQPIRNNFV